MYGLHARLMLAFLLLAAGRSAIADRILPRDPIMYTKDSNKLSPRQYCPANYDTCYANSGDAICMAPDEVCCQYTGSPYTCPMSHPYCCPPDPVENGGSLEPLCGTDGSCSGPVSDILSATALPTVPTGGAQSSQKASAAPPATNTAGYTTAPTNTAGYTTAPATTPPATATAKSGATSLGWDIRYEQGLIAAFAAIFILAYGVM
jgi:hypothetical protein